MHRPFEVRHGHSSRRYPQRSSMVPPHRLPYLSVREITTPMKREAAPSTSFTAQTTCGPNDNTGSCQKYTSSTSTTTLPVALGTVLPLLAAIILLLILHRRHVKKLRHEDANDKHKSLDFGLGLSDSIPGSKQMTQAGKPRKFGGKGISLDLGSPYLLPPELHNSRESLHSLSRSIIGDDDKYRPAASFLQGDNGSLRSFQRGPCDNSSVITGSTRFGYRDDGENGLLRDAQRMSQSSPPFHKPHLRENSVLDPDLPDPDQLSGMPSSRPGNQRDSIHSDSHNNVPDSSANFPRNSLVEKIGDSVNMQYQSDMGFSQQRHQPDMDTLQMPSSTEPSQILLMSTPAPRISISFSDGASDYAANRELHLDIPAVNVVAADDDPKRGNVSFYPKPPAEPVLDLNQSLDTRRLTLGVRPLPPEDPADNPEQRANRIRSFYKEYFDESKPGKEEYCEDYGPEYAGDRIFLDSEAGEYYEFYDDYHYPPYAEPVTRRAMTPPPRAPPRFRGSARHMATNSASGDDFMMQPGPRAFSSVSGRFPGARGQRNPLPPPSPLNVLPTPHLLKDDAIIHAADFAPGRNIKDQRDGRPETPRGGLRPFLPTTRIHSPLVSSFDELSVIPSPHALRKSGTFTALDFAPPPKFKNIDTASDAGSIRSNRTGISAVHVHNIRAGAYRLSRLPVDTVGTKDDILSSLHPKWDIGR